MVEAATVDAYGEAEQVTGWHCVIEEHLDMPLMRLRREFEAQPERGRYLP